MTNFFNVCHPSIIGTLAAFLTTLLFLKFDKKKFSEIGLTFERKTIVKFFLGVVVGIAIMGLLARSVMYFTNVGIEVIREVIF